MNRLSLCLALLAAMWLPSTAEAAAQCVFDPQGRLLAPFPSVDPGKGWGGMGGTGHQEDASPDTTAAAPNNQTPGWGGMGGTGIDKGLAEQDSSKPATIPPKGWGGVGGTGIRSASVSGWVLYDLGNATARQGDLPPRRLAKGDPICEGDTIATGVGNSLLQIRLADKGFVQLRADSRLRMDRFLLPPKLDGSEKLAMTLDRGAMRAITGDIGKLHKENYRIRTPLAEVHIRGTDHEVFHITPDKAQSLHLAAGTYNHVLRGGTTLSTDLGSVRIDPEQSGFVPLQNNVAPKLITLPSALRALPLPQASDNQSGANQALPTSQQSATDITNSWLDLGNGVYSQPAPSASAYFGVTSVSGAGGVAHYFGGLDSQLNSADWMQINPVTGVPVAMIAPEGSVNLVVDESSRLIELGSAKVDGAPVTWGSWADIWRTGPLETDPWEWGDFHHFAYSAGGVTPMSVIQNLQGTATFGNLVGATTPTSENGARGGQLNNLTVNVQLGANPGATGYHINVTDGYQRTWQGDFNGFVSLSDFSAGKLPLNVSCSGCDPGTASGAAGGVIIGTHGKGLITGYGMNTSSGNAVSGAAVVSRP